MTTQAATKLKIAGDGVPEIKKLWNGRFRLEFLCTVDSNNTSWYGDNVDKMLPPYGTKMGEAFAGDSWELVDGVEYDDMCLVETGTPYINSTGEHMVSLAYETLTGAWVAEKDEDIDFELNGLQRVTRTFVALPETSYAKVVGTDTITVDGKTLTLGSANIKKTDAKWELTEVWLESGTISTSTDLVGSQQAQVIESFGEVPATPSGYSLAKTDVSNVGGIPTNRYTFLKPSILSVSQQFIGGSATVQVQAFNKTSAEVDTALSEVTATHVLISERESDYEGIKTSTYTYEVDDFNVFDQTEVGFSTLNRTELSATNFTYGTVGTDLYATLYLASEQIDNGGAIKLRKSKWSERGVISVRPLEGEEFSLAPSYSYTTLGQPASAMTGLTKPDGTLLGTDVTWLEPSVQNFEGFPTYTQEVINQEITGTDVGVKVDSYEKFFSITDPGVMSTGGAFNRADKSGGATRYPEATSQPQTYRKKATVDVYLTTSSAISETEVAYSEKDINWCSIAFDNFYTNEKDSSASVSANWRSFPQYLNSAGTTGNSNASTLGEYFAEANSYGAGSTSYTKTGIYRVEITKYQRKIDATQLYLRTVITF